MDEKQENYGHSGEVSFSEETWKKLMATVDNMEHELFLKFAVTTALRREDAVSVLIENIDFENKRLTYYEKKKRRWRTIPMDADVLRMVKQILNLTKRKNGKLFDFCGKTAWNILNRYCKKAGIEPHPFHAIRATSVKFYYKANWDELEISNLTGDTIEVLRKHYRVPSKDDMDEVMSKKPIL